MQQLPDALTPLADYRQFVLSKLVPTKGKDKKLPVDPLTLQVFKEEDSWQNNPTMWTDAITAINLASVCGPEYFVGFFLTPTDPFFFVDIDDCLQPDNDWSPVAYDMLNRLPGAAVEVSQSGRGLHIIGSGVVPDHGCRNLPLDLELYTEKRLITLTGTNAIGSAGVDCTAALPALVSGYFPPKVTANPETWTTGPAAEWNGPDDDGKLIKKALASKSAASAFGARATFADLWNRNIDILSDIYAPDASDTGEFDESQVDAALAQHLAFWTGNDCDRMLVLMKMSGLVRQKWTSHKSYLRNTIIRAVSLQTMVYTGGKKKEPERVPVEPTIRPFGNMEGPEILTGYQFLGITQQIEHFKGCVYITNDHKIFTPNGSLLKSEQFNATYGGYVFQMDTDGGGKVSKKAWEAFTESQAVRFPKADLTTFRPDLESGSLINHEDRILVNTYVPIETPRIKGDITPFLTHLSKVLPDVHDQGILLAYMAACIQHKGVKFQWTPLIQGAPGNGKTLFTRCVEFAIGERYTHMPPASEIAEKFNDWLFDKMFIGVEDVFVPEHKREVIEILKPMITNNRLAKRAMQQGQIMHHICANFMLNSNHLTAIRKTKDDRRFAVFYTAQQKLEDIIKDDMGGDYFPNLYDWLKGEGKYNVKGYAIVADYLASYQIPAELNPAGACHRAPETTSTQEAINMSMGGIEQEILEAIDEGRPGFAGGWVSSMALERLLQNMRKTSALPPNKRRELLQSIGYDWHPNLKDGRVNNTIPLDGGKPRLFIKDGHIHSNLGTVPEIVRAYTTAQGSAVLAHSKAANVFNNNA